MIKGTIKIMKRVYALVVGDDGTPDLKFMHMDYKATHAYRGTPQKPRRRKSNEHLGSLFKGHRV